MKKTIWKYKNKRLLLLLGHLKFRKVYGGRESGAVTYAPISDLRTYSSLHRQFLIPLSLIMVFRGMLVHSTRGICIFIKTEL